MVKTFTVLLDSESQMHISRKGQCRGEILPNMELKMKTAYNLSAVTTRKILP